MGRKPWYNDLACDWLQHNEVSRHILGVHGNTITAVTPVNSDVIVRPQADHSMCSCLRRESMRAINKALKIAHFNHVLV